MERTGDTTFQPSVKMKIGPVSATFKGNVDSPTWIRQRLSDERGRGGRNRGFAKGGADVTLTERTRGHAVRYDVQANVGGKIAQMGARLIDGITKRTADQFFASFAAECVKAEGEAASSEAAIRRSMVTLGEVEAGVAGQRGLDPRWEPFQTAQKARSVGPSWRLGQRSTARGGIMPTVSMTVNGKVVRRDVDPDTLLIDFSATISD